MIGRAVRRVMYVHGTHATKERKYQSPRAEAESHTLQFLNVTQTGKVVQGSIAQRWPNWSGTLTHVEMAQKDTAFLGYCGERSLTIMQYSIVAIASARLAK